jgi:hypothetical protein
LGTSPTELRVQALLVAEARVARVEKEVEAEILPTSLREEGLVGAITEGVTTMVRVGALGTKQGMLRLKVSQRAREEEMEALGGMVSLVGGAIEVEVEEERVAEMVVEEEVVEVQLEE